MELEAHAVERGHQFGHIHPLGHPHRVIRQHEFPAGEYKVSRVNSNGDPELAILSYKKGGALLHPIAFDRVPGGQARLMFEQVGDKHVLSQVETPRGVYTFGIPRAMTALARVKDQGTSSSFGSN